MCSMRLKRCTNFSLRALKHPKHKQMFPISENYSQNAHNLRNPEKYTVNFSSGEKYKLSTIPFLQRNLNKLSSSKS